MRGEVVTRAQGSSFVARLLILVSVFVVTGPAFAQSTVFKTKKSASSTWSPILPLTVGVGFEYESDSEQTEYNFPMLVEYNFTERFRAIAEPSFARLHSQDPEIGTIEGLGDLETSLEYEFLRERRYTPALTMQGLVKWPTATDPDLGTSGIDYAVGLIASKDCGRFDLDSNLLYTFSGDPELQDSLEISLAAIYPLNHFFELEAEVVQTLDIGSAGSGGSQEQTEGTIGYSWLITPFQTLQQGFTIRDDGSWQLLIGWQYNFGGE